MSTKSITKFTKTICVKKRNHLPQLVIYTVFALSKNDTKRKFSPHNLQNQLYLLLFFKKIYASYRALIHYHICSLTEKICDIS